MKRLPILFILFFLPGMVHSQDTTAVADLQQVYAAAKNQNVPVEEFDRLSHTMRYFDTHPVSRDQEPVLLDTYRAIAAGYTANNHFKQAYGVYQKLLALKEDFLATEKSEAIAKANSQIKSIEQKDEDELLKVQNEIQQTQMDSEYLQSKRKSFKKYFSFIIVSLTALFAFLLLQASLKLSRIKSELSEGRNRLKLIHRVATLGQLKKGIFYTVNAFFGSIPKIAEENLALTDQLHPGEKNQEVSHLRKQLNDLKKISPPEAGDFN